MRNRLEDGLRAGRPRDVQDAERRCVGDSNDEWRRCGGRRFRRGFDLDGRRFDRLGTAAAGDAGRRTAVVVAGRLLEAAARLADGDGRHAGQTEHQEPTEYGEGEANHNQHSTWRGGGTGPGQLSTCVGRGGARDPAWKKRASGRSCGRRLSSQPFSRASPYQAPPAAFLVDRAHAGSRVPPRPTQADSWSRREPARPYATT